MGRADGRLQLWGEPKGGAVDGRAMVLLRTFDGHRGRVEAAGVSPNGRYVVSVDEHGTAKSWDLMRPAICREFERELAGALEELRQAPVSEKSLVTLRGWYAFCGRDVPLSDLVSRAEHAAATN